MRRFLILLVLLALGGCQVALPGAGRKAADGPVASPIIADAITVTSLDAPKTDGALSEGGGAGADDALAAPDPLAATPVLEAKPEEAAPSEEAAPPVPEIEPAPEAVVTVKTQMHLACEKTGGRWSMAGSAEVSFCQTPTRDAGKQCTKGSDCDGYCLSKSRTCAPYTPLLGCNEVLDDQGRMLTECIN